MSLTNDDWRHVHKVLSSDIQECEILSEGAIGGRATRMKKRIADDKRVLARVERILGHRPEWAPVKDE